MSRASYLDRIYQSPSGWCHHAFVIRGAWPMAEEAELLERLGLSPQSADVWQGEAPNGLYSVDYIKVLNQAASMQPTDNSVRVVISRGQKLPPVSQNALLKLLEDGTEHTIIILNVPLLTPLLPTLLSRVEVIDREASFSIDRFLTLTPAKRLEQFSDLSESDQALKEAFAAFFASQAVTKLSATNLTTLLQTAEGFSAGFIARKYAFETLCLLA